MEKKIDENLHLKLKLFSTEIDLERVKLELFTKEAESCRAKLETLQKSLQTFVEDIKSNLADQGYNLTRIDLEKGVVELKDKPPTEMENSDSTPAESSAPNQS